MKCVLRRFLCFAITILCCFSNSLVSYAAESDYGSFEPQTLELSEDDGTMLKDLDESFFIKYADSFASSVGYADYSCFSVIPYWDNDEWIGYFASYRNEFLGDYGFAVMDFSESIGHYVTEFSFGIETLPLQNQDDVSVQTVSEDSDDVIIISSSSQFAFSYDLHNTNGMSTYGSVMNGTQIIPSGFIFSVLNDVQPLEIYSSKLMDSYDPEKSLISRDYLFEIGNDRYVCTIAAALALMHQEDIVVPGMSDADVMEWLWRNSGVVPVWSCTVDNHGSEFKWLGYDSCYKQKPDGSGYCVAGRGSGVRLFRVLYGQNTKEHDNSLFFGKCGFSPERSSKGYYTGYNILPTMFMEAVDKDYPSIFAFLQNVSDLSDAYGHAVNVVGYVWTNYHFDVSHNPVVGDTLYLMVADGWNDDAVRFMDVTNMKFKAGSGNEASVYFMLSLVK